MNRFVKWLSNKYNLNQGVYLHATQDQMEAKRVVKANDMANCLWELEHNAWRRYKHEEPKEDFVTAFRELINECYEEHGILTEDLTE